nr:hypothetical protein [Tanacetum cinerariifolium]
MAPTAINHRRLFRQTITILDENSLHFFTLSLVFLPLTMASTAAIQSLLSNDYQNILTFKTLAILVTAILSTITGVALITYSTNQAILCKPLTFTSTTKSLRNTFKPLLSTSIAALIEFTYSSVVMTLIYWFFLDLFSISCGLAVSIVSHIGVWGSAPAIVVLESRSGKEVIRQSEKQSSKLLSYSIFLYTVGVIGIFLTLNAFLMNMESVSKWLSIVQVGFNYFFSLMMMLQYVAANTVLYVEYRQVARGEEVHREVSADEDVLPRGFTYMMFSSDVVTKENEAVCNELVTGLLYN